MGTVVFIGLANSGKTTILNRLIHGEFTSPSRTMGLNVDELSYRKVRFRTFDLGGQETFHLLWSAYVERAAAVVYVVDASNPVEFPESYQALKNALEAIPDNCSLLLLANKSDLDSARTLKDILKIFDLFYLQNRLKLKGINIFLISAKTGESFYEAFDWLVGAMTGEILPIARVSLQNVWIFDERTGLPLAHARFGSSKDNPELVTPLLSAIDQFASELDTAVAGIAHVVLQRAKEGKDTPNGIRLVKVADQGLVCILAVNEHDSVTKTSELGQEIIEWTSPRVVHPGNSDILEEIAEKEFLKYIESSYEEHLPR